MNKAGKTKKFILGILAAAGTCAVFSFAPAYAAYYGATLSEVSINPLNDNSYQIIVKTDKDVPVQKVITSNDNVVLDLKNTRPAGFVNTIYNNTPKIDHVIVQPAPNDHVKVFLQGENISSSQITVDANRGLGNLVGQTSGSTNAAGIVNSSASNNSSAQTSDQPLNTLPDSSASTENQTQEPQDTIILSRPVDSFKPVATYDNYNDAENPEESADAVQSAMSGISLQNIFKTSYLDWMLRLGMLFLLIFGGYKLFFKSRKKVKIDLSSNLKDREVDLFKTLNNRRGLVGAGLPASPKSTQDNSKISGYSSFSRYGLKEYQNSHVPPSYSSLPRTRNENRPLKTALNNSSLATLNRPTKTLNRPVMPPTPSTSRIKTKDINTAKVNIDSMKFLESMAKIYEKSGRTDLAQGLQNNLLKAKVSKKAVS